MATVCANVCLLSDRIDLCYGRRGRFRAIKIALRKRFGIIVTHPKLLYDPDGSRAERRKAKGRELPPSSHAAERHAADRTQQDEQNRLDGKDPFSTKENFGTHFLTDDIMWAVRLYAATQHETNMEKRGKEIDKPGSNLNRRYEVTIMFPEVAGEGMRRTKRRDWNVHSIRGVTIRYVRWKGHWYETTAFPDIRVS